MSTDPSTHPDADPQTRLAPDPDTNPDTNPETSPESSPASDPDDGLQHEVPFDNSESNPNSGGPQGLTGQMGVSSERTGPLGDDPRGGGISGLGSTGGSLRGTDGEADVSPGPWDGVDVSQREVADHERPDEEISSTNPAGGGLDRSTPEPRPAPIKDEKLRRRT